MHRHACLLLALILLAPMATALDLVDDAIYVHRIRPLAAKTERTVEEDFRLAGLYSDARQYGQAEAIYRKYLPMVAQAPFIAANLSVYCGKQGRYEEALRFADQAIAAGGAGDFHPVLVKASWLWELGRKAEAMETFASVPAPAAGDEREALYYGCVACFYASVGDVAVLRQAIERSLAIGDDHFVTFIRRDVIFDRYRGEPWFIDLVGVTIRPATP